ncbi:MAG: hypothetical protein AAF198_04575 [Pseudomonadota bacterium]
MILYLEGVDCGWTAQNQPSESALKNAQTLLYILRHLGHPPSSADRGYFPSVRLFWNGGTTELEVHDTTAEAFYFPGAPNQSTWTVEKFFLDSPEDKEKLIQKVVENIKKG